MFKYYEPRLKAYRDDLKRLFNRSKREIKICIGKATDALPESQGLLCGLLKEIFDEFYRPRQAGSAINRLDSLVCKAFAVRELKGARADLENILNSASLAKGIYTCICFLGRLRAAHRTFLKLATTSRAFAQIQIHPVRVPKPISKNYSPLNLAQTFSLLGLELSDSVFKKHISKNISLKKAVTDFAGLQNQSAHIHAEVQLLFFLAENQIRNVFPFVGGSKRSCFLCAAFIKVYGNIQTRGSHGHLYSKWIVPRIEILPEEEAARMSSSLDNMYQGLRRQLLCPLSKSIIHVAESSIGLTASNNQNLCETSRLSPIVRRYMQEKENQVSYQRWLDSLQSLSASASTENEEDGEDGKLFNMDETSTTRSSTFTSLDNPIIFNDTSEEGAHDESTGALQGRECGGCPRLTTRKCSRCGSGWYCSSPCESHSGSIHKFTCSMGRPLHSADYLHRDCIEDIIPEDPDVVEHFGFHRFPNFPDRAKLLGLYKGLFYLDVSADRLDSWRCEGTLVENIIETFSSLPEGNRGSYFPWFLEHRYCLDRSKTRDEALNDMTKTYYDEARLQLEPEDQNKEVNDLEPPAKRTAFKFLAMTLHGWHPPPSDTGLYCDFGFCTCLEEYDVGRLGGLYQKLLVGNKFSSFWDEASSLRHQGSNPPSDNHKTCTFTELWRALEAGKLINLMDSKGFESERRQFRHLDTFLGRPWYELRESVWGLQAFLNEEGAIEAPRPVLVDYGFINCNGFPEITELKSVYKSVLQLSDPLALHDACVCGRLFKFARSFKVLEPRLKKLMRNPYPLQSF